MTTKNPPPEFDPPLPPKFVDVDKIRENIEELEFWEQCVLKQLERTEIKYLHNLTDLTKTADILVTQRREFIKRQNDNNTTTNS